MAAGVEQLCSGRKRKLQRDYRHMTMATPAFSSRAATNNVPRSQISISLEWRTARF